MERLRAETRPEHERTEGSVNIERRLASCTSYKAMLARFYGFYSGLEPALEAAAPWETAELDAAARRKLPMLRQDLENLGLTDEEVAALPVCHDLPDLATPHRALGALYVIEGSTLGGQIIAKLLRQNLNVDAGSGGAFFSAYGSEVGRMWREFAQAVDHFPSSPEEADAVIEGARDTFDAFGRWMAVLG